MRKFVYLVGLFVLASLPAVAQEKGSKDVSVEYSYFRANPATPGFPSFHANGGFVSVALNPRTWYGFAGEFGDNHVGQVGATSVDTNLVTYMFGPQLYFHPFGRFMPFAHELFGGAHSSSIGFGIPGSRNSFAMALGGGVDMPLKGHWSVRFGPIDYLLTEFHEPTGGGGRRTQNNMRVSGGVRWRF